MKDQYVGDINDYLKYSILRQLAKAHRSKLVVCWMLTPADDRSDGSLTGYLDQAERFRHIDPPVFDGLRLLTKSSLRTVASVEAAGFLRPAAFQAELLADDPVERARYFDALAATIRSEDLVFFDPDNGFEVSSVPKGQLRSSKYLYWDEWECVTAIGCSVCVYQHFPRRDRIRFVASLLAHARSRAPGHVTFCLYTSRVVYLVSVRSPRATDVAAAAQRCAESWRPDLRLHPVSAA